MKLERSKIEFPLWRKKVDSSIFDYKGTIIPTWACTMWGIQELFSQCTSKKNKDAEVRILFRKKDYPGWITIAREKR